MQIPPWIAGESAKSERFFEHFFSRSLLRNLVIANRNARGLSPAENWRGGPRDVDSGTVM